jgi:hypothetical protein
VIEAPQHPFHSANHIPFVPKKLISSTPFHIPSFGLANWMLEIILGPQAHSFPFAFMSLMEQRSFPQTEQNPTIPSQQQVVLEGKLSNAWVRPPQNNHRLQQSLDILVEKLHYYVWTNSKFCSLFKMALLMAPHSWPFAFVLL